jgi:hypothetical protein
MAAVLRVALGRAQQARLTRSLNNPPLAASPGASVASPARDNKNTYCAHQADSGSSAIQYEPMVQLDEIGPRRGISSAGEPRSHVEDTESSVESLSGGTR